MTARRRTVAGDQKAFEAYQAKQARKAAREAEKRPDYAGLRLWVKNRQTGSRIAVYDGIAADLDTDAGRWQTVCETHGTIISHGTLALARSHAADPQGWCEACRGDEA